MVTGSLQIKGLVYYVVLNVYPNNKRNQKWIPTTVIADGKKVNQMKAEKLLSDIRMIYDKDSYIDNKKTVEQLLQEQNQNSPTSLTLIPKNTDSNDSNKLKLNNQPLSSEEELIITKCLSTWYNISKEEMINSLMSIIKQNPNTHLIKKIITDLVNKLSDDPREQRLQKMGHYRDMLFSDYIKEWLKSIQNQVAKSTYKGYYDLVQNKVPIKDIQIWLGHSNIQTTMIYTHLDETNKEVSAQVLIAKFQYILTNYNEKEIYEMEEDTLNNIYEDIDDSIQFKDIEKVVATHPV